MGKLELPTTDTKNELQRRLKEQQGIDIETYEFEDEYEREIQAPAVSSTVDINSLLAAMMEKMEVTNQKLFETSITESKKMQEANRAETQKLFEASRIENQKLLANTQEAYRAENQKLLANVQETSRAENQKFLAESRKNNEQMI